MLSGPLLVCNVPASCLPQSWQFSQVGKRRHLRMVNIYVHRLIGMEHQRSDALRLIPICNVSGLFFYKILKQHLF